MGSANEERMNHEVAFGQLVDLVEGRLSPEQSEEVRRHATSCPECRPVLETATALRVEVAEFSGGLFTSHPSADDLASFAITPSDLPPEQIAGIRIHERACPTCALEVRRAREADASAWRRSFEAWFARPSLAAGRLAPALAVLLLLLAYPAYLGIFELPRARDRRSAAMPPAVLDVPIRPPVTGMGGAARALVLEGATRGGSETPSVQVAPDQTFLPILLDMDLSHDSAGDSLRVSILRADGTTAWARSLTVGSLWDSGTRTGTLLIPSGLLGPGAYDAQVRQPKGELRFNARFVLMPPRP
jgi:anti-sigma factor RsiW